MPESEYIRQGRLPVDEPVRALYIVMTSGQHDLFSMAPMFIKEIIDRELWKPKFNTFRDLIEARLPDGLETNVEKIKLFVQSDPALKTRVTNALKLKGGKIAGRDDKGRFVRATNIISSTEGERNTIQGTSEVYTRQRLCEYHPDLYKRVMAGEMSANKAAIQAGFRKKLMQVEPTVEGFAKAAWKYLTENERIELVQKLL